MVEFSELLSRLSSGEISFPADKTDLIKGLQFLGQNWNQFFGEESQLLESSGGPFYPEQQIISPHGIPPNFLTLVSGRAV